MVSLCATASLDTPLARSRTFVRVCPLATQHNNFCPCCWHQAWCRQPAHTVYSANCLFTLFSTSRSREMPHHSCSKGHTHCTTTSQVVDTACAEHLVMVPNSSLTTVLRLRSPLTSAAANTLASCASYGVPLRRNSQSGSKPCCVNCLCLQMSMSAQFLRMLATTGKACPPVLDHCSSALLTGTALFCHTTYQYQRLRHE